MRYLFSLIKGLWYKAALMASLLPAIAHAQAPEKVLTTYYDSARTQRRAVYRVQLRGPRPDTVAHGPFRRFARTGSLVELGHFANGQADSIWTRYYAAPTGQTSAVARRLPMRAGQPDGPFIVFYPDGRVAQRGTYRRGQLVDSLVTTTKNGQPRLLAHFDSSRVPGLLGSFRQWGGQYTAIRVRVEASFDNPYPTKNSLRYWTGQLAAGRLVGAYTEHDADGEPRVRLSYTAQGQYRLTTLYYPAAWLRNEQSQYQPLPPDSVVRSRPFFEWQAVGRQPYLLQRHWSFNNADPDDEPEIQVFKLLPAKPGNGVFSGDITRQPIHSGKPFDAPYRLADAANLLPAYNPPSDCNNLYALYVAKGKPQIHAVAKSENEEPLRRYLPLSAYQQPVGIQAMHRPGRWRLGAADTTGASLLPAQHRETILPDKRRMVETPFTTRIYSPGGQLVEVTRLRWVGRKLVRRYYSNGRRESIERTGWLASYSRAWNEDGHRIVNNLRRVAGVRLVRVRRQVTRHGKIEMRSRLQPRLRKPRGNIRYR